MLWTSAMDREPNSSGLDEADLKTLKKLCLLENLQTK